MLHLLLKRYYYGALVILDYAKTALLLTFQNPYSPHGDSASRLRLERKGGGQKKCGYVPGNVWKQPPFSNVRNAWSFRVAKTPKLSGEAGQPPLSLGEVIGGGGEGFEDLAFYGSGAEAGLGGEGGDASAHVSAFGVDAVGAGAGGFEYVLFVGAGDDLSFFEVREGAD